jgi:hypothetical protein
MAEQHRVAFSHLLWQAASVSWELRLAVPGDGAGRELPATVPSGCPKCLVLIRTPFCQMICTVVSSVPLPDGNDGHNSGQTATAGVTLARRTGPAVSPTFIVR